jgi:hypothetical protein
VKVRDILERDEFNKPPKLDPDQDLTYLKRVVSSSNQAKSMWTDRLSALHDKMRDAGVVFYSIVGQQHERKFLKLPYVRNTASYKQYYIRNTPENHKWLPEYYKIMQMIEKCHKRATSAARKALKYEYF